MSWVPILAEITVTAYHHSFVNNCLEKIQRLLESSVNEGDVFPAEATCRFKPIWYSHVEMNKDES